MKIIRKMTVPPAVLAVKKSMGTLDKVISMIESKKNYAATIQQIDAAMGLATAAKRSLMATLLEDTVKAGSKNPKKLVTDLQKLYTSGVK
jgi:DNA-binding FrmR family transcriptional regulator